MEIVRDVRDSSTFPSLCVFRVKGKKVTNRNFLHPARIVIRVERMVCEKEDWHPGVTKLGKHLAAHSTGCDWNKEVAWIYTSDENAGISDAMGATYETIARPTNDLLPSL